MNAPTFRYLPYTCLLAVFLSAWQLAAYSLRFKYLFGDPISVGRILVACTADGSLPYHALITGAEAVCGFFIGVTAGTLAGFSFWYAPRLAALLRPVIFVLSAVPVFAFAPMVIVWFGIGFAMKVAVAAFGTFLIALAQSYEGAKAVDEDQVQLLKLFGATRFQVLTLVIVPSSLVWVFQSMKLNVGFALLGAFIGEFISSAEGVGSFMNRAGSLYDIPSVLAGGCYLILIALLFQGAVIVLERNKHVLIGVFAVSGMIRRRQLNTVSWDNRKRGSMQ